MKTPRRNIECKDTHCGQYSGTQRPESPRSSWSYAGMYDTDDEFRHIHKFKQTKKDKKKARIDEFRESWKAFMATDWVFKWKMGSPNDFEIGQFVGSVSKFLKTATVPNRIKFKLYDDTKMWLCHEDQSGKKSEFGCDPSSLGDIMMPFVDLLNCAYAFYDNKPIRRRITIPVKLKNIPGRISVSLYLDSISTYLSDGTLSQKIDEVLQKNELRTWKKKRYLKSDGGNIDTLLVGMKKYAIPGFNWIRATDNPTYIYARGGEVTASQTKPTDLKMYEAKPDKGSSGWSNSDPYFPDSSSSDSAGSGSDSGSDSPSTQGKPKGKKKAAAKKAEDAGLTVIMDRCPKIEFARLSGELGWSGINTKVITSRRSRQIRA